MILSNSMSELINRYLNIQSIIDKKNNNFNEEDYIEKLFASSMLNRLILSKTIFKKNKEIGPFLDSYFDIQLSKYALKSRTLICGKVTKYVLDINDKEQLIDFLNTIFNVLTKLEKKQDIFSKDIYDVIREIKL
ncbi:TPA: hypothetical protein KSL21_003013 [Clostridioides difficile]|uniref:hypothetical protein n=2 Tax=Clostridioides difficile TaxID=1496 RepID=UPI00038D17E2|nr:hypothetical protein [Clostridioides difficile]EGT3815691.1 hypothetical protein [Clostridioides difficile]EGT3826888.1 hypothetical protein [Clostridioides difficile]EGT4251214.1 hypothetical protein [Clostridioides difficile]EGT4637249.1 hypothetical protein [Clostridioides difficile]EGT4710188.1 hypothetical protein [Clostridioides difficile]